MNRLYSVLLILLTILKSTNSQAQCPSPSISAPDSACKNIAVSFTGSATGNNLIYEWDFNAADTRFVPAGGITGTYMAEINSTTGVDYFKENNNYIAICLRSGGNLTRIVYGSTLNSTPTVTDLGNLGTLGAGNRDFAIVEDNGNWYGVLVNAFGNCIRIDFGSSLMNTPTVTPLTIPGGLLSTGFNLDLKKMGNDFICMIANNSGGNVSVLNFGNTMANATPTCYNIAVPGTGPISAFLLNDCGHLLAFVAYASGSPFSIIDFGSAVSPTPVSIQDITTNSQSAYREFSIINDGYNWILIANTFGGDQVQILNFGSNIMNLAPSIIYPGTIGAFGSGFWCFAAKKYESEIGGIACNYNTGELSWFRYPSTANVTPDFVINQNATATFNDTGYYVYSLTVRDSITGNSSSIIDSIYISEAPDANFITGAGCTGFATEFTSTSTGNPIQFQWDFGDSQTGSGSQINHQYGSAGSFTATLVAITDAGCSDTAVSIINVNDPPQADFLFANNPCAGANVTFTDNSTTASGSINQLTWVFSNGDTLTGFQATNSFPVDGQFPIQLFITATTGCIDSIQKTIDVIPGPIANYTITNTCLGDTVVFNNQTTITGGLSVDYVWNFTANDSSLATQPTFPFPAINAADYPVLLTATATNGCVDTITQTVHIGLPANVYFSTDDDTVCTLAPVQFADTSIIPSGEILQNTYWNFGDSSTDTNSTNVSHSYASAGTYQVELIVQTATNCLASVTKTINVIESPTAAFNFTNACEGITVNFQDISTSSSLTQLASWSWDFGDTTFSTLQNPSTAYSDSGTYNVTLIATDNNGCADTTTLPITIYPTPEVNFGIGIACTQNPIQFTDSTTITGTNISNWQWSFGDGGSTSAQQNPQHIYTLSAAYPVTLIATTAQGCIDSITKLVPVNYSPEYQLTDSKACIGTANAFSFVYTGTPISNAGYIWNFGDSSSSLQANPTHTYNTPGIKTVIFTLTNLNNGCAITDTIAAEVIAKPEADFITDSACVGDSLFLNDISTTATDPITQWKWSSNLFATSTSQNLSIPALSAGTYAVKLIVTTSFGCKDSITANAVVFPTPEVSFTANPDFGSPPLLVTFTNTSDPGTSYWNFGDGSAISNTNSPDHLFADTGKYIVQLTTISPYGCKDSAFENIYVLRPYLDLAIINAGYQLTGDEYLINTQLRNLGNTTIDEFKIQANLQGKSLVSETYTSQPIAPGATLNFTLSSQFNNEGNSPEYLCLEIITVNGEQDEIAANNYYCTTNTGGTQFFNPYPNPAGEEFTLALNSTSATPITIETIDSYGRYVRETETYSIGNGFNSLTYSCRQLPSGSYVLRITQGEEVYYVKFVRE